MKKTLKQREGQLKYALHNTKINASLRMTIYEILYLVTRTWVTQKTESEILILPFKINLAVDNGADSVLLHTPTNQCEVFLSGLTALQLIFKLQKTWSFFEFAWLTDFTDITKMVRKMQGFFPLTFADKNFHILKTGDSMETMQFSTNFSVVMTF